MDKTTVKQLALALGAAVAVALIYTAWQRSGRGGSRVPWSGAPVDWGRPAKHGCDATWMGDILPHPHPVYRQWQPGANREGISRHGWQWITDPPQEMGLTDE